MTIESGVTTLVKTYGTPSVSEPGSTIASNINKLDLVVNGTELDIAIGMFDNDAMIANQTVKETLALLLVEAAKIMEVSVTDLISPSASDKDKLTITEIGLEIINRLRPNTSQIGVKIVSPTPASTVYVNRNILA
tara:strand:- start:57 stop:461 length:405 start_codon:yes stop_codon:yes gene_type:complete